MYPEKKGGSHKMARRQQNWGLLTLLTRWASIWTMPNTASPKSEPPCGRAVYTPVGATILGHPPQKTAPRGASFTNIFLSTVYPKKYAHGFCFAVLCCGYTLTDFPISIRLTSLALWQSNDCPSASKATLTNMDKYFMWIHYERLHNNNKAKHNKTVCMFLGIYCNHWFLWMQLLIHVFTLMAVYLNHIEVN